MRSGQTDVPSAGQPGDAQAGACIWMTGRSGAGKSTVTAALLARLASAGRVVTVLDTVPLLAKTRGERTSEGKLLRKAFVASEVVRHGGIVICVTVSARSALREQARQIVGPAQFLEVYFKISPELADARRVKRGSRRSLRKRLKRALLRLARLDTTGPRGGYESPLEPELTLDTAHRSPDDSAQSIVDALVKRGIITVDP